MARRTVITLIDDVDGSEADETVMFGVDGRTFEIDLSAHNAARLRGALEPWVGAGRRTGGRKRRTATSSER